MKLKSAIENLKTIKVIGDLNVNIVDVKIDSNSVTSGTLFICLSGQNYDSHNFIKQVEKYGAVAVITEKELDTNLTQIIVKDTRLAMPIIAGNFYGHADKKLKIIGVTGTNGKTTTTHLIKNVLEKSGVKCGIIGTLGVFYDGVEEESTLTTPDPLELHRIFSNMVKKGVKVVAMEVSAHALYLKKLEGLTFDVGIFTNLTRDHLDFFCDMNEYKRAKLSLFDNLKCRYIVSNVDDEVGIEIYKNYKNVITYGLENPADVFAIKVKERINGTSFVVNLFDCVFNVKNELMGRFNVYNLLSALTACCLVGISPKCAVDGVNDIKSISGRLEKVYGGEYSVYVDYAHTPDGLKKVLITLKPLSNKKLICVFGCGGNRDNGKREEMGRISGEFADFTVITSDNPRYEEPMDIIRQIEEGILQKNKNYVLVQDRTEGIRYALNLAKKGDVVLVAGKGSEKYQEILGIKHFYNDKDTIIEIIEGKI